MQNTEEVQENTRQERNFLKDHLTVLQEHVNMAHNINARHRDELQKDCHTQTDIGAESFQQTSDMQKEQMRGQLRTAVLKAEILQEELHMIHKIREDDAADREYERAYMMWRIRQMEERENMLGVAMTDYLIDDSSNASEPDGGDGGDEDPAEEKDIAEHTSWH
jgi:hypothetical protein